MAKKNNYVNPTFFEKVNRYFDKHGNVYFWIIFGLTLLFGLLLYDPRVSLTGDDSVYILSARNFYREFTFPTYQGPLYPIVLSALVWIFGISLFPLKMLSLVSLLGFMYFTYKAFKDRIPSGLLFFSLLLVAINSGVLYYGSQTYNEAFYMFMLSVLIFVFFRYFIIDTLETIHLKSDLKRHLFLALALLGVALTRSIGFSIIIAVVAYFLFYRQWKNAAISLIAFVLVLFAFQALKAGIWHENAFQLSSQGSQLMSKDFYHPEYGKEDLAGFVKRLLENSNQYLSQGLLIIMGLRHLDPVNPMSNYPLFAILIYALAIGTLYFSYKKNKHIFFTTVLTGCFLIVSFVILQTNWNQDRLIIPAYPYILLILLGFFYFLFSKEKYRSFQPLLLLLVVILFISGMNNMIKNIGEARKLKDEYSGLTPDWRNYMQASRWIGGNLKENELAASRKPAISTIYGEGKNFYGIYTVPAGNMNAFMERWNENQAGYAAFLLNNKMTNDLYRSIMQHYYARLMVADLQFIIAQNPDSLKKAGESVQAQFIDSPSQLAQLTKNAGDQVSIFYADSLLMNLKANHVTHVLTANIRINPNVKTGQTVSTVERYMYFIQEKYPEIFTVVKQIGADNDEPARVLKINWETVNK
ncbi:MAG: hypothetical protein FWD60_08515 [Candidatus Azobacteroides sp.]|nr:hypothetical protein [Candidatus Azobacteroides sp.]